MNCRWCCCCCCCCGFNVGGGGGEEPVPKGAFPWVLRTKATKDSFCPWPCDEEGPGIEVMPGVQELVRDLSDGCCGCIALKWESLDQLPGVAPNADDDPGLLDVAVPALFPLLTILWIKPGGRTAGTLKPGAPCWNGSKECADARVSCKNRFSSLLKRDADDVDEADGAAFVAADVVVSICESR